jgi:uncharacterized protein (DUF1330 family)
MAAYVIANVDVQDQTRYDNYRRHVLPSVEAYGGRFLVRAGPFEVIEGDWMPKRLVILEFPDMATVKRWYDSPEYQTVVKDRWASTKSQVVFVDGMPPGKT